MYVIDLHVHYAVVAIAFVRTGRVSPESAEGLESRYMHTYKHNMF
jgi:hypothetical protein